MKISGFSKHKVVQGAQNVAAFLDSRDWTERPDLEKRGAEVKGTPYVQFGVKENEAGQIGVISQNGWSVARHNDEAAVFDHQHRIFANRDKA